MIQKIIKIEHLKKLIKAVRNENNRFLGPIIKSEGVTISDLSDVSDLVLDYFNSRSDWYEVSDFDPDFSRLACILYSERVESCGSKSERGGLGSQKGHGRFLLCHFLFRHS